MTVKSLFKKAKCPYNSLARQWLSWKDGIHLIHGGMTPLKAGTPKLYACKVTFQKAKFLTVEYLESSHCVRMDFISSMGG